MAAPSLPPSDLPVPDAIVARRAGGGFAVLAGLTWVLLVFGSTVRVHGAGLACPDWPLCFGELVPRLDFRIFLEWGHRVLAGSISLGFLAIGGALLSRPALRARFAGHLAAMAAVLVAQIVLGGLTVLLGLAFWSVTLHLLCGNLFLATMILLSRRLSRAAGTGGLGLGAPPAVGLRVAAGTVVVAVALQLGLGGLVSSNYAGMACTEWPTCNGGVWFPTWTGIVGLQLFHRLGACGVVVAAGAFVWLARADGPGGAGRAAAGIMLLVLVQIGLGVASVFTGMPVELAVAHAGTAHALFALVVYAASGVLTRPRSLGAPTLHARPETA